MKNAKIYSIGFAVAICFLTQPVFGSTVRLYYGDAGAVNLISSPQNTTIAPPWDNSVGSAPCASEPSGYCYVEKDVSDTQEFYFYDITAAFTTDCFFASDSPFYDSSSGVGWKNGHTCSFLPVVSQIPVLSSWHCDYTTTSVPNDTEDCYSTGTTLTDVTVSGFGVSIPAPLASSTSQGNLVPYGDWLFMGAVAIFLLAFVPVNTLFGLLNKKK